MLDRRARRPHQRLAVAAGAAALLCTGGSSALATQVLEPSAEAGPRFEPGHVIVRYRPGTDGLERAAARRGVDARPGKAIDLARAEVLRLPAGRAVSAAVTDLEERPEVEFAQPDWIYRLERIPNDPRFRRQWSLHNTGQRFHGVAGTPDADIDAPEAWDVTTGSDSIVVGVIDTGVNTRHPDIAPEPIRQRGRSGRRRGCGRRRQRRGRRRERLRLPQRQWLGLRRRRSARHAGGQRDRRARGERHRGDRRGSAGQDPAPPSGFRHRRHAHDFRAGRCGDLRPSDGRAGGEHRASGRSGAQRYPALNAAIEASPGILFTTSAGNHDPATGRANNNDIRPHWPSNLTVDHANVIAVASTDHRDALSATSSFGATTVDLAAPGDDILGASVPLSPTPVFSESFQGVPRRPSPLLARLAHSERVRDQRGHRLAGGQLRP